jgi:hypothetical protein
MPGELRGMTGDEILSQHLSKELSKTKIASPENCSNSTQVIPNES